MAPVRPWKAAASGAGKAVWAERTAVGRGQHWAPMTERTGRTTEREQRPRPDRSWTAATLGVRFMVSLPCVRRSRPARRGIHAPMIPRSAPGRN